MSQPIEFPGPMIETHELRKNFRSGKTTVEAVRGVDLRVDRGQIFGFLGPNGAGGSRAWTSSVSRNASASASATWPRAAGPTRRSPDATR